MLQFLDNQPVPFASPARFSTGGLCSASKDKRWLPVETSLSPTGSSACVASSSYIHNNFSDMAAALAGHLSFARMPCSCVVFIWKSRNKQPQKPINVGMERGVAIIGAQMVRPMMTVTMTNFDGTMLGILGIIFANFCLVEPSKFVTVTLIWAAS